MRRERNPATQHKRLIYGPSAWNRIDLMPFEKPKEKRRRRRLPNDCAVGDEKDSESNNQSRLSLLCRRRRSRFRVFVGVARVFHAFPAGSASATSTARERRKENEAGSPEGPCNDPYYI